MAFAAYRSLFRATRLAFRDDRFLLNAARNQIRAEFRNAPPISQSRAEYEKRIKHAHEVASVLRANVVQGVREESGDAYKLRIHSETERGDNDSINSPNLKLGGGGCGCS